MDELPATANKVAKATIQKARVWRAALAVQFASGLGAIELAGPAALPGSDVSLPGTSVGSCLVATVGAPASFMAHFTVFVLACFVGYMVIWNVTAALHTPLMSVTNAISSIIIIGAILQISSGESVIMWVAGFAVTITAINITGGFAVTRRMLEMFRK